MRLTLRTLLAYRDGVLSPGDREDLHRRIQTSQDAGNLLKRIASLSTPPQLISPPLSGKGLAGDANAVAEYLDDALHGAKVPELERECLISDPHLAELAECHHLLSTAMQTQVTVPEELQVRVTALQDSAQRAAIVEQLAAQKLAREGSPTEAAASIVRTDAAHATRAPAMHTDSADVGVQVQAPMLASGGESIKPQGLSLESSSLSHEVPEYLLGSNTGSWKIPLAIGALLALLALLVWQAVGPWDRVVELFAQRPADSPAPATAPTSTSRPSGSAVRPEANERVAPADSAASEIAEDSVAPPGISSDPSGTDITESNDLPPGLDPVEGSGAAKEEVDSVGPPSPASDSVPATSEDSSASRSAEQSDLQNGGSALGVWLPQDARDKQAVFLVMDDTGAVTRLAPGEAIPVGATLVVPPVMRGTLALQSGVLWTASGPSILRMANGEQGTEVAVRLCRALLRRGPDASQIHIATPIGSFVIELLDRTSIASLEFGYRRVQHGSIINNRAYQPVLIVIAAEGSVNVGRTDNDTGASQNAELSLGDGIALVEGERGKKFRLAAIPNWFRTSVDRDIDGLAAADLHRVLTYDSSAEVVLKETVTSRRSETAALAVQTVLMLGNWSPLASGFLDNERMRAHWEPTIELARQLIASDPQIAEDARQAFLAAQGEVGSELFSLLCGPAEDLLASGEGLSNLVAQLDNPRLDVRVLAAYQLRSLTGKSNSYQPHSPNRASIQQWRRELMSDRLKILPVQDFIWERNSNP